MSEKSLEKIFEDKIRRALIESGEFTEDEIERVVKPVVTPPIEIPERIPEKRSYVTGETKILDWIDSGEIDDLMDKRGTDMAAEWKIMERKAYNLWGKTGIEYQAYVGCVGDRIFSFIGTPAQIDKYREDNKQADVRGNFLLIPSRKRAEYKDIKKWLRVRYPEIDIEVIEEWYHVS